MELKRITDIAHPDYPRALELYSASFPEHERREENSQAKILKNPEYHFDVIYEGGAFAGEILYWDTGAALYVEHFCILPGLRGHGLGHQTLELLRLKPVILEIDPPEYDISIRRKDFYERCGFTANPYSHIHPPYHRSHDGHRLVIMSRPDVLTPDKFDDFVRYLHDIVMNGAF